MHKKVCVKSLDDLKTIERHTKYNYVLNKFDSKVAREHRFSLFAKSSHFRQLCRKVSSDLKHLDFKHLELLSKLLNPTFSEDFFTNYTRLADYIVIEPYAKASDEGVKASNGPGNQKKFLRNLEKDCKSCGYPCVFDERCLCEFCVCDASIMINFDIKNCICGSPIRATEAYALYMDKTGYAENHLQKLMNLLKDFRIKWEYSTIDKETGEKKWKRFCLYYEKEIEEMLAFGSPYIIFDPEHPGGEGKFIYYSFLMSLCAYMHLLIFMILSIPVYNIYIF